MQYVSIEHVQVEKILASALAAREVWSRDLVVDNCHVNAFRLLNGFLEGLPDLVVDVYAQTLVLFIHSSLMEANDLAEQATAILLKRLPWVQAVIVKKRGSPFERDRNGVLTFGATPNRKIIEGGVWYAVDLTMNLDASLYLDTRLLRTWLRENMAGKRVLNTFAYTGSLGVAAVAGGARQVFQLDLNRKFLNLAKDSYALNGFTVQRSDFWAGDFWTQIERLKRVGELFDCVIVDPPFFSQTGRGKVDLVSAAERVINKVRPLVGHEGQLVIVNNALFLSGAEFLHLVEEMCKDGYLFVEELISVPPDCAGFEETRIGLPPADPTPFNHSTKIIVLRVKRKDGKKSL